MWKSKKAKRLLTGTLALTILALFISNVYAHTITVPTNVYFGFGNGLYIRFNPATTFDTTYRENGVWYFDGKGVQVENANLTVEKFFVGYWTILTLEAASTVKSNLTLTNVDEPTVVYFNDVMDDRANYTYTTATKTLVCTPTHASTVTVKLYYGTYSGPPSGSTGPIPPVEQPPYIPPVELPKVPGPEFQYGIIILVGIVGVAATVAVVGRSKPSLESQWRKKTKAKHVDLSKKWKKKAKR